jgi:hypothetical protein
LKVQEAERYCKDALELKAKCAEYQEKLKQGDALRQEQGAEFARQKA